MLVLLSSRWVGWKLALATIFSYLGVTTVMAQIETAYFLSGLTLPPALLPRLVLMGLLTAVIFIPLAVVILWRVRAKDADDSRPMSGLVMPLAPMVVEAGSDHSDLPAAVLRRGLFYRLAKPGAARLLRRHRSWQLLRAATVDRSRTIPG